MNVLNQISSRLVALALLGAAPLGAAQAASTTIQASANVVKALQLTAKQDLDFGTIVVGGGSGTFTVSISQAGTLTCPSGLSCSGAVRPAIFNVQGSNGQVVRIIALASGLTNSADGSKLRFTPAAPPSLTLTNSGQPGKDFNVGGSINIPSTTTAGLYSGTIEVTVDYQ